jgi:hypothetical protein
MNEVDVVIYKLTLSSIYRKHFLTYLRSVRLLWGLSAVRSDASVPRQLGELDRTAGENSTRLKLTQPFQPVQQHKRDIALENANQRQHGNNRKWNQFQQNAYAFCW